MIGCLRLSAGGRSILVPARAVLQVVASGGIVPVPGVREGAAGLLPLAGRAVPIFRLEALDLPFEESPGPAPPRAGMSSIVVLDVEGAILGLLVDRTETVRTDEHTAARALEGRDILEAAGGSPGGEGRAETARGER